MSTWWSEHPDLEGVARRGRDELIGDAASAEADTEQFRLRRRSFTDVCFEWMSRGDRVTVAAAGRRYEGELTAAVNDLVIIATQNGPVAVNTTAVEFGRSDETAAFTGTTGDRTISSFRALLGRHEVEATRVRLIGATFDVVGTVVATTDDHVLVSDDRGAEWALPQRLVATATPVAT